MATLVLSPATPAFVRIKDLPIRNTRRIVATLTTSPTTTGVTITKAGGATWLTVPANVADGVPFNIDIDETQITPGDVFRHPKRTETLQFRKATYTDLDVVVTLEVKPGGPPRV